MNSTQTTRFAATATQVVEAFESTAHTAIDAFSAGGERLGDFAAARWDRAFKETSPRLTPETRRNAANARRVVGRYYRQGLSLSTTGATAVVSTLVQAAGTAIERAEALRQARGA
jgi:hypothetical protein